MTTPTVGRKVWYRPTVEDQTTMASYGDQPLDATVVAVNGENNVNLAIFDAHGLPHQRKSVYLVQDGQDIPEPHIAYAEWMPYQKTQAKKYAEVQNETSA